MTITDLTRQFVEKWGGEIRLKPTGSYDYHTADIEMTADLTALLDAAQAEERERCAKIAEVGHCISITNKPDFDMLSYVGCRSGTPVERIEISRTTIYGSKELAAAIRQKEA